MALRQVRNHSFRYDIINNFTKAFSMTQALWAFGGSFGSIFGGSLGSRQAWHLRSTII